MEAEKFFKKTILDDIEINWLRLKLLQSYENCKNNKCSQDYFENTKDKHTINDLENINKCLEKC